MYMAFPKIINGYISVLCIIAEYVTRDSIKIICKIHLVYSLGSGYIL